MGRFFGVAFLTLRAPFVLQQCILRRFPYSGSSYLIFRAVAGRMVCFVKIWIIS
jgi:hypothetical protein